MRERETPSLSLEPECRDGFKLEGEHRDGCFAAQRAPAFVCFDGYEWKLRQNGHRGGSTMWFRFTCNDPSCMARLLVRWDVIAGFLDPGLDMSSEPILPALIGAVPAGAGA